MQSQVSDFTNEISNTIDPFANGFEALGTSFNPFGDDNNNPVNPSPLLIQALKYADDGLKVFPLHYPIGNGCSCRKDCHSPGKHPMTYRGSKEAATDQNQITQWWTRNPQANIGIVTGQNNFYVLDIDVGENKKGDESLSRLTEEYGDLPKTWTATTGSGGKHYCFKYSGMEELGNRTDIMEGIDFRGNGGYIVAAPSMHKSGMPYSWDNEYPLAEMPLWLVELVSKKDTFQSKSTGQTTLNSDSQNKIHNLSDYQGLEGSRNTTLFQFGCSIRERNGLNENQLLHTLRGYNETLRSPLPDSEVRTIANGICSNYSPGNRLESKSESSFLDFDLGAYLSNKYETESNRDPNELLGYKLNRFKNIEKTLEGIQSGFYIIAAETNVGKTAFLTNVYLDLVESNPELTGIFLSMDDPKKDIVNKILARKTNISITNLQKRQANKKDQEKLKKSYDWLIKLAGQERIRILDQGNLSSVKQIETLASQASKPFFIALDGLFNVEVGDFDFKRDENIERANSLKRIADKYEIPLICTAEVRKSIQKNQGGRALTLDDIMETAKFAYNANLVWLLSENGAEEERSNSFLNHSVSLNLDYAKNKLTGYKKMKNLTYHTSFGRVSEPDPIFN